jgi:predicted SAM-dependent methyltransferase
LNVGCGAFPAAGFCNLDYDWAPGRLCWDITKRPLPFPNSSLEGIYTEHCLEHISIESCGAVLREFRRILKPGGVVRIVVPDGGLYCELYMRAMAGESVEFPYPEPGKLPMFYVNRIMHRWGHQFIYDFNTMESMLKAAGFAIVERAKFGEGRNPKLLVDQEERRVESLYVEAVA